LSTDDVGVFDQDAAVVVLKDDVVGSRKTQGAHSDKIASSSINDYGYGSMRTAFVRRSVEHATASTWDFDKTAARILLQEELRRGNLITDGDLGSAASNNPIAARLIDGNETCGGGMGINGIYDTIGVQGDRSLYVNVLATCG
jgi:hypothetical protein